MSARLRTPWRDNLEAMTMAIVMALLLKVFIVEAYQIPSGSMQPTLIGDEASGLQDRILVDKLSYTFRAPERWEVAVFRYPLNRAQNFVKRIVGVGPEQLRIENGDLWQRRDEGEPWRVLRRPRCVQRAAWKALDATDPESSSWEALEPAAGWDVEGRTIRARGDGRAVFRRGAGSIMDRYLDGYPEAVAERLPQRPHRSSRQNTVGDLRLAGEVRALPGCREVVLELQEGLRRYRFRLPGPAAEEGATPRIEVSTQGAPAGSDRRPATAEAAPYRLPADAPVAFAVQNMDDLLQLEVAGNTLVEQEVGATIDQRSSVLLDVAGEGADLVDLMVYRDIYYLAQDRWQAEIPAGHYYMLGDNTQDSSDSRHWRFVRFAIDATLEDGPLDEPLELRGGERRLENPLTFGHGDPDGPKRLFVDEFGERHWFPLEASRELAPVEAPFVPRDKVLGRALAVFWPIHPLEGIYRLKWVR